MPPSLVQQRGIHESELLSRAIASSDSQEKKRKMCASLAGRAGDLDGARSGLSVDLALALALARLGQGSFLISDIALPLSALLNTH